MAAPAWVLAFALLGAALLGALGLVAGIVAEKIDQLAAFQNFFILPLTFLSGVFYSIHSLPEFWQRLSHANPFFYVISGFRHGFLSEADSPIYVGGTALLALNIVLFAICYLALKSGWKIKN